MKEKEIYFIYDGKYVKMGMSENPRKRLKELQTGNPNQMILLHSFIGNDECYEAIQEEFKEYNYRSEWYCFDGELKKFIDSRFIPKTIDSETEVNNLQMIKEAQKEEGDNFKKITELIFELSQKHDGRAPIDLLISESSKRYNKAPEETENIILSLKSEGTIFQPSRNYLKIV